jgi:hypothetical protein
MVSTASRSDRRSSTGVPDSIRTNCRRLFAIAQLGDRDEEKSSRNANGVILLLQGVKVGVELSASVSGVQITME